MRVLPMALLGWLAACAGPRLDLAVDAASVRVTSDGAPFAEVRYRAEPRPHVWPLFAPGGVPVTRDYPMAEREGEQHDHPHHQSLWIAHGDVDGYDFWHGTELGEYIAFESIFAQVGVTDQAIVQCEYVWRVKRGVDVLRETRQLVFGDDGDVRTIDVVSVLRPVRETATLGDTKEGTFAVRVHPALRAFGEVATGALRSGEGATGDDIWGSRARWIDDSGVVDGQRVGVAIFDHPDNLRHPTRWHARRYGLLAANPFGVEAFEKTSEQGGYVLRQGAPLTLRYRVVLHRGLTAAQLDAMWAEWAEAD